MEKYKTKLKEISDALKGKRDVEPVTIRDFLWWFEIQRRTANHINIIDRELRKHGIRTVPGYTNRWVDSPISFVLIGKDAAQEPVAPVPEEENPSQEDDPSYRIGNVESARKPPVSVRPNDKIGVAYTTMMVRNYSQLPVMSGERSLKGVVSWESIGARLAANASGDEVRHYMADPKVIGVDSSLFEAISVIKESNYVLIRDEGGVISGIVTASDIAGKFSEISAPFLLLNEIEINLRIFMEKKVGFPEVCKNIDEQYLPEKPTSIHSLTFGNLVHSLRKDQVWKKLSVNLDKDTFMSLLDEVNKIRNNVMHFSPDPLEEDSLRTLNEISHSLKTLRSLGVY